MLSWLHKRFRDLRACKLRWMATGAGVRAAPHLAGVDPALQEASADHPVCEGEVVERVARLLVYDAHPGPLQDVGLGSCKDRTTCRVLRGSCSVPGAQGPVPPARSLRSHHCAQRVPQHRGLQEACARVSEEQGLRGGGHSTRHPGLLCEGPE